MIQIKTYKLYFMSQLFAFNPSNFRHGLHLWHADGKAHKNNPVLMLMPPVWKHNIEVTWSQCYYVTGVNQAGLQQFSNFKPPIVLENPGIQFYISRVLEKKTKNCWKYLKILKTP